MWIAARTVAMIVSTMMVIAPPGISTTCATAEPCRVVRIQLETKRVLLEQYLEALGKASIEKDQQLMAALNHSIGSLIQEIGKLTEETAECPPPKSTTASGELSPVRSDPGTLVKASCSDLTKKHLQLSRKINSMARHQQSLFSDPTPEERAVFSEAQMELKDVEAELRSWCAQPRASTAARNKQRNGPAAR